MVKQTVVSGSSVTIDKQSFQTARKKRSGHHASRAIQRTSVSRGAHPSRLEFIVNSTVEKGFSKQVAERVAGGSVTEGTHKQYESKWNIFAKWCKDLDRNTFDAFMAVVAVFFEYLFTEKSLSGFSLDGYRAAINSVWSIQNRSISDDPIMTRLFTAYRKERLRPMVSVPAWNLEVVLNYLRRPKFDRSTVSITLRKFAAKTEFLLFVGIFLEM